CFDIVLMLLNAAPDQELSLFLDYSFTTGAREKSNVCFHEFKVMLTWKSRCPAPSKFEFALHGNLAQTSRAL
ncbi:hypothetical protein P3565_22835, partial [Vibrio parahaemolyticus]|nr:hypothetical protein [Vibrio parahaemolyticus]